MVANIKCDMHYISNFKFSFHNLLTFYNRKDIQGSLKMAGVPEGSGFKFQHITQIMLQECHTFIKICTPHLIIKCGGFGRKFSKPQTHKSFEQTPFDPPRSFQTGILYVIRGTSLLQFIPFMVLLISKLYRALDVSVLNTKN